MQIEEGTIGADITLDEDETYRVAKVVGSWSEIVGGGYIDPAAPAPKTMIMIRKKAV